MGRDPIRCQPRRRTVVIGFENWSTATIVQPSSINSSAFFESYPGTRRPVLDRPRNVWVVRFARTTRPRASPAGCVETNTRRRTRSGCSGRRVDETTLGGRSPQIPVSLAVQQSVVHTPPRKVFAVFRTADRRMALLRMAGCRSARASCESSAGSRCVGQLAGWSNRLV